VRRALLAELPALTRFYGLTPADLDGMTFREISEYQTQMYRALSEGEAGDGVRQ
jgi:hypothetical protein